jgi:hypothetical protein
MEHFLAWFVPTLKFAAIFISGVSGILALSVDFKDKDNNITVWGRRAVYMVVISFVVSAAMQAIEIYQDHQKDVADNQKTQNILYNINRQLYNIDEKDISFDVTATLNINNKLFKPYYSRLQAFYRSLLAKPNMKLPSGVTPSILNSNSINGLTIMPGSSLYPDSVKENEVYDLIGRIMLDVKIFKYDSLKKQIAPKYSLSFPTTFGKPRIWFTAGDTAVTLSIDGLKIPPTDFSWRNQGDIQSLLDLKKSRVTFTYGDEFINDLDDADTAVCKKINIVLFSFNIAGRRFSSGQFCKGPNLDFPDYYIDLPEDILATHLNIPCK